MEEFEYDVALSFAGEDRHYVTPIADGLKGSGVNVFYDTFEQANLWGKDLYQHLSDVYFKKSRFCVLFSSHHYAQKNWTNHELRNAQARAFQEHSEYLLPIRLDDTEIKGILPTVGYIDYSQYSPEQIVQFILEKLDHSGHSTAPLTGKPNAMAPFPMKIQMPKIRKTFTQREKDKFGQEAFAFIMQYFEQGLKQLEAQDIDVETEFFAMHRHKFTAKVYVKGEVANGCKIWLGGWGGSGGSNINYLAGNAIDVNDDSSLNEMLSVSDDGHQLRVNIGGISGSRKQRGESNGTPENAAEYLWDLFIQPMST